MMEHFGRRVLFVAILLAIMTGCTGDRISIIEDSDVRRIVRLDGVSANVYVIERERT